MKRRSVVLCAGIFYLALGTTLYTTQSALAGASSSTYSESMNKSTVTVKIGSTFKVALSSMYWQISPVKGTVVTLVGKAMTEPIMPGPKAPPGCQHPGTGCGKQTWTFKAKKVGMAVIQATRSSCGEALRCVGDQGIFTLKVKVAK